MADDFKGTDLKQLFAGLEKKLATFIFSEISKNLFSAYMENTINEEKRAYLD